MSEFAQAQHQRVVVAVVGGVDDRMFAADVGLRGVRRAEVDHGHRLLRIKSPIQHADNGFHDELDDDRAARRTEHRVERTSAPAGPPPAWSNTSVGAIVLRGRLPGWIRLGTGAPSGPAGSAEKSVSWLLRMKPSTMWNEPNADSTVVVSDAALPCASMMLI